MRQVVIFTSQKDPHVDHMIRVLDARGRVQAVRLNTEEYPAFSEQSHEFDSAEWCSSIRLESSGRTIHTDLVQSIWLRRPGRFTVSPSLGAAEQRFASAQSGASLMGALGSSDAMWMNSIQSDELASNKLHQLHGARRCGLNIPETIVTDAPRKARNFMDRNDWRCVYKPLVHPLLTLESAESSARIGPTLLLSREHAEHLGSISLAPVLLQRYIDKKFEVRATIVGDQIFAGLIDSQATATGRIDYREAGDEAEIRPTTLPEEVEAAIMRLMRLFDLRYAAIDLICDLDGNYWFLDLNPSGQYLFVELAAPELAITDALASLLETGRP